MIPKKLNVGFVVFSYGGNGGAKSEHPDIREWLLPTVIKMKADPRIGEIRQHTLADTPITMTRNRAVMQAREEGTDVLCLIDSDMSPDLHLGQGGGKPFWETSFDFLYKRYDRGPVVIGAPYCGPPGGTENVYVFRWEDLGSHRGRETPFTITAYSRGEAFYMKGIQECAALPTGLIMYDMRAFELIEPSHLSRSQVLDQLLMGKMTKAEALAALREGFFAYEWESGFADKKASTEDVQNTRDISLVGERVLGYNPVFCNWDAWAGHNKFWCVGKPTLHCAENVSANLSHAVANGDSIYKRVMRVDRSDMEFVKPKADWSWRDIPGFVPGPITLRLADDDKERLIKSMEEHPPRMEIVEPGRSFTADDQPLTVPPGHPDYGMRTAALDATSFERIRKTAAGHEKYKREYPEAYQRSMNNVGRANLHAVDSQSQAIVAPPVFNFDGRTTEE